MLLTFFGAFLALSPYVHLAAFIQTSFTFSLAVTTGHYSNMCTNDHVVSLHLFLASSLASHRNWTALFLGQSHVLEGLEYLVSLV